MPFLSPETLEIGQQYRHVKRGSIYTIIAFSTFQAAGPMDNTPLVVYRSDANRVWTRPMAEFVDGRFERVYEKLPFELVRLSDIPQISWKGRAVFHPHSQIGATPFWNAADCPMRGPKDLEHGPSYDVGVVLRWDASNWRHESDNPAAHEVYFLTGNGGALHYAAGNLWTPTVTVVMEMEGPVKPAMMRVAGLDDALARAREEVGPSKRPDWFTESDSKGDE